MFGSSLPTVVCWSAHALSTYIVLCFCFVFLRLVYHMLPVSLDFPFLIKPSVFSSVYSNDTRDMVDAFPFKYTTFHII